jgi:hypothetical protein
MSNDPLSNPYTIVMGQGTQDVLCEIAALLDQENLHLQADAESYEALCERQRQLIARMRSYIFCLTRILTTTRYDGDEIQIVPDHSSLSLLFQFTASGYHGGMIHRPDGWSVHT